MGSASACAEILLFASEASKMNLRFPTPDVQMSSASTASHASLGT